ncbi:MSRA reductase, partial [Oceanites oceanicus]|nr:MSRA reductase [Oceanites oceanicus]
GTGCFWGAEQLFWKILGVFSTQVGYMGGFTPNPTYEEVRTGNDGLLSSRAGHAEVVGVVSDPQISYEELLKVFWESHDPTEGRDEPPGPGMGWGGPSKLPPAMGQREWWQGDITAAIEPAGDFYSAEDCHQQYPHMVPGGSCGLKGTGVTCPM